MYEKETPCMTIDATKEAPSCLVPLQIEKMKIAEETLEDSKRILAVLGGLNLAENETKCECRCFGDDLLKEYEITKKLHDNLCLIREILGV